MTSSPEIWILEDDEALSESLSLLLKSGQSYATRMFGTATSFIEAIESTQPENSGCILMDVRLPDGNGHTLYDQLKLNHWPWPAIFMTGHGDLEMAVKLMQKGAYDYVLKPYDTNHLLSRIQDAIEHCEEEMGRRRFAMDYLQRLMTLSGQEKRVYDGILSHKTSRELAEETANSTRTVELHRSHMFKKMNMSSAVELAQAHERYQLNKHLISYIES